jgi:hypothetical protein
MIHTCQQMVPLLATGDVSMMMATAALLILIVLLLRRSSGYFRRRRSSGPIVHVKRPPDEPARLSPSASSSLDRYEVQLYDTARELTAQLDSKMAALQRLIHTARQEQARLEELIHQASDVASDVENRQSG